MMYKYWSFLSMFLKVVSEEHEDKKYDLNTVKPLDKDIPEVSKLIKSDQKIAVDDITVWVDPLDATQEYTGTMYVYVVRHHESCIMSENFFLFFLADLNSPYSKL